MTSTPPFREKMRQAYSNSPVLPGASGSGHNPFVAGPNGHPNFMPVKFGTKGAETRIPKPPKQPEKPLMPYMRYSRKVWDQVKAQNQELKLWQIGKVIGQMWRDLSDTDKQEFVDGYEAEKLQYNENMKLYHNSPAYQAFLKDKQKAEAMIEEEERNKARLAKSEPRVTIQPADDEDDSSEGFSVKHVAAARYYRNHRLIAEIFNDVIVPDVRSIVSSSRIMVVKKQVQSLTAHQAKLESELKEIEEKFEAKKRRLTELSDEFQRNLKEVCDKKPRLTDDQFEQMVARAKEELRQSQKEHRRRDEVDKAKTAGEEESSVHPQDVVVDRGLMSAAGPDTKSSEQEQMLVSAAEDGRLNRTGGDVGADATQLSSAKGNVGPVEATPDEQQSEVKASRKPASSNCSNETSLSKEDAANDGKDESSADNMSDEEYPLSAIEDEASDVA